MEYNYSEICLQLSKIKENFDNIVPDKKEEFLPEKDKNKFYSLNADLSNTVIMIQGFENQVKGLTSMKDDKIVDLNKKVNLCYKLERKISRRK